MPRRSSARDRSRRRPRPKPTRETKLLNLLHAITLEVVAAQDLMASLGIVLRRICEGTGWAIGQAWMPSPDGGGLACSPAWFTKRKGLAGFRSSSESMRLQPGVGLPGRVWVTRRPAWIRDVRVDPNFPRAAAAAAAGLKGAVGIPVTAGDEVVAVLEFFVQTPRDEDERLTRVIATIAAELNLVLERKRIEDALRDREAQLRASLEHIRKLAGGLIVAQEAERTRIARDLHDDVNQRLAGLSIAVSGLRHRLGDMNAGALDTSLAAIQQRIITLVDDVRRISHDLHPGVLQHIGLHAAIESHCAEFQRQHGIAVALGPAGDLPPVPTDVALCLFRSAQEALRNVATHAAATQVQVRLVQSNGHWRLSIADDGRGFDAARRSPFAKATEARRGARAGLGLMSIRERAHLLDGQVRVESAVGSGTTITIAIPLRRRER